MGGSCLDGPPSEGGGEGMTLGSTFYRGSKSHLDDSGDTLAQRNFDDAIEGIARRASQSVAVQFARANPIACPCCSQLVNVPPLEIVIDHYGLTPLQGRILGAVWRGKGYAVETERIFDAMYVDDPDGGPSPGKMYSAFKVALCRLRARLQGSGIDVENVGYRRGFRLVVERK